MAVGEERGAFSVEVECMPGKEREKSRRRQESPQHQEAFPCEHCGSDTYEDRVKAALWGNRGLIAIEEIPARVCEGCGEQFYDEETTRKIEKVIAARATGAKQKILVPLFSLAQVEVPQTGSPHEVLDEEEMEAIESVFTGMEQASQEMGGSRESQEAFLCKFCQSNTREAVVKSAFWGDGGLVAVEDIPARVCEECKEQFYNDETTRKIDKLTEHGFPAENAKREILVPVFSLAEVEIRQKKSRPPKGVDD